MKKFLISIIFLFSFLINVSASEFEITSDYAILYNLNEDTILYEENSDEKVSIASLTKMMTAIVAIENIEDFNKEVTITNKHFYGTTGYMEAGFKVGDKVTYLDLLYGILLPSGAEAVNAVVDTLTKDTNKFVDLMNAKAEELQMKNTKFSNPIGKDDVYNYSSAKDVATLLKYAIKNPLFKKIFTTREYTVPSNGLVLKSTLTYYSSLFDISIIKGSKSGFTKDAGRCLASIAKIDDVDYLFVVIKSDPKGGVNAVLDTLTVYNYYKDHYQYYDIIKKDEIITRIPIKLGTQDMYEVKSNEDVKMYLKNDAKIHCEYKGIEELTYHDLDEEKLGQVNIYNDNELIYTMDVYLNDNISFYHPYLYGAIVFSSLFVIAIIVVVIKRSKNGFCN